MLFAVIYPLINAQASYVMPIRDKGGDFRASPFYNREAFARWDALVQQPKQIAQPYVSAPRANQGPEQIANDLKARWMTVVAAAVRSGCSEQPMSSERVLGLFRAMGRGPATVVYIVAGVDLSLAILVSRKPESAPDISVLELSLTSRELDDWVGLNDSSRTSWFGAYRKRDTLLTPWMEVIALTMRNCSRRIMEPIEAELLRRGVQEAYLIPTGSLSFLPLHCCTNRNSSASVLNERVTWHRLPSARFLARCEELSD